MIKKKKVGRINKKNIFLSKQTRQVKAKQLELGLKKDWTLWHWFGTHCH